MFRLTFDVEKNRTYQKKCFNCFKKLLIGEIRIAMRNFGVIFHLNCFSLEYKEFIVESDLNIILRREDHIIFDEWLSNWNKNLYPLDYCTIYKKIPSQSLNLVQTPQKRLLIEIFKFLHVKDIISSVIHVNKEFYQVSWSKELWQNLLIRDFNYNQIIENPKEKYSERFSFVCKECFILTTRLNFYRCPLLKKTFCKKCIELPKYLIIKKYQIRTIFKVDPGKLKIDYFTLDRHKIINFFALDQEKPIRDFINQEKDYKKLTFLFIVKPALEEFRKEQKEKVLKMIQILGEDHPAYKDIKAINIYDMDVLDTVNPTTNKGLPRYKSKFESEIKWKGYKKFYEFIQKGKGYFNNEREEVLKIIKEFKNINVKIEYIKASSD